MSVQTQANTRTRTGHLGAGTWWEGRSGLIVPVIMAAFSTYLLVGILTMEVAEDADQPGPQFFPMLIMIVGYAITVLLTIAYIRNPEPVDVSDELPAEAEEEKAFSTPVTSAVSASRMDPHEEDEPSRDRQALAEARAADSKHRTHSDFVSLAWGAGGFAAFALILEFAGWIIAAALLFWCVARSMGSKKPLFDLTVALTFSSLVYIAFAVMLGLNLPSGILGGGF
ncbi:MULTISPECIES: tripartite tricarboxylate transporter TctB family protein [unclassified Brevibacterium]|uniref:tripartite tricarboxylate transporter TctB family protein n=1 Tax=unclassified Brevibacterium TaxID=2614124 RepID=UPI001E4695DA|nr:MULTISPECIES: tripartite tricarboxylate transporter TctB family protein [unclassified Brevibacterium]MCD1287506.1 tripartite tricarboxylate transporter TctB family protein [Brevibacterium sp. CCUG 69071]MDK8436687.1 tripartite tricarboxylate transporter TctB family protein [Brevibacterium sp. H-BE7]